MNLTRKETAAVMRVFADILSAIPDTIACRESYLELFESDCLLHDKVASFETLSASEIERVIAILRSDLSLQLKRARSAKKVGLPDRRVERVRRALQMREALRSLRSGLAIENGPDLVLAEDDVQVIENISETAGLKLVRAVESALEQITQGHRYSRKEVWEAEDLLRHLRSGGEIVFSRKEAV